MPHRRLSVFHQFYYLSKQNSIAVSSVLLFCLRSLSGWQICNYTFLLFILVQNWISYFLLGLPKCFKCWNSLSKTKAVNSRRSSASSIESLECKVPGLACFVSHCLTYIYIFLTEVFLSLYHTRFKATNNCNVDRKWCGSVKSSLSQDREHVLDVVLKGRYLFLQPSLCSNTPSHWPLS